MEWLILIVVLIAVWFGFTYNSLVRLRNRTSNAWSQVDVQLKRRYDLIPNLVETVKGYASHERDTLEAVRPALAKLSGELFADADMAIRRLGDARACFRVLVDSSADMSLNDLLARL